MMYNSIVCNKFRSNISIKKTFSNIFRMIRNVRNLLLLDSMSNSKYSINHLIKNQFSITPFYKNEQKNNIKESIEKMIKDKPVVVFMKGTPSAPRCGFSRGVVQILNMHQVNFDAHNILEDEELRSGIKEYSNWPTIPQVFFKGEFIGGFDILADMHRTGELTKELLKIGIKSKHTEKDEK